MTQQNISLSASFYSNDWEIVRKEKLHLFAEIDEQNFYLYAISDENNVPVCFEQYALSQHQNFTQPENILSLHQQIKWLKEAVIDNFIVMIQNTPFQILPNELNWLTNNGGWQCTDLQSAIDGKIIYEIAGLMNAALQNFSSNIKYKHPLSGLLNRNLWLMQFCVMFIKMHLILLCGKMEKFNSSIHTKWQHLTMLFIFCN